MIQFLLETDREQFDEAFRFARQQVRKLIENHPDFYPMYTSNGRWKHEGPVWTNWCEGFLPGMMWLFQKRPAHNGDDSKYWQEQAIRYSAPIEARKHDRDVHDLGFLFMPTYYRWYQVTHDPKLKNVIIEAGKTQAMRFQENGLRIRSSSTS